MHGRRRPRGMRHRAHGPRSPRGSSAPCSPPAAARSAPSACHSIARAPAGPAGAQACPRPPGSGPPWYCDPDQVPDPAAGRDRRRARALARGGRGRGGVSGLITDRPWASHRTTPWPTTRSSPSTGRGRRSTAIGARARWRSVPVRLPRAAGRGRRPGHPDDRHDLRLERGHGGRPGPGAGADVPDLPRPRHADRTPGGTIAIDRLRFGDTVWTLDDAGRRIPGTVLATGSTPVPPDSSDDPRRPGRSSVRHGVGWAPARRRTGAGRAPAG